MADLKKLQEMAKNGEVSKELMEDEEFKKGLKNILKEECGVEITDSEIPDMLKKFEENLYREQKEGNQVLSEEDLEGVSGGVSRAYMIKLAFTYAGWMIGWKMGAAAGGQFVEKCKKEIHEIDEKAGTEVKKMRSSCSGNVEEYLTNKDKIVDRKIRLAIMKDAGTVSAGMLAGASAGNYIGELICKKLNIK